jgi:multidrug efflux system outer membrane protein
MARRPSRPHFCRIRTATGAKRRYSCCPSSSTLWGRLRRATEAARASLLSAEENRKAVVTTLVSDVATAYFNLRELDYELDISTRTLATRRESLDLTQQRQTGGVATDLDLRQSEQLVETAAETIPALQQQIEQTENQISLLLGRNPGPVVRGKSLTEQEFPPEVPAGLPSALLERRPDIRAAEQNLIAANAQIGVAKAAYFPRISLTALLGGQSTQLSNLFAGPQQRLQLCSADLTADLHRRETQVECETSRGAKIARWCNTKKPFRRRSARFRTR